MNDNKVFVFCPKYSTNRHKYKAFKNTIICNNEIELIRNQDSFNTADKIIIHQLNFPRLTLFWLCFYPNIVNKIMWSIWGGDLYNYLIVDSLSSRINEWLKGIFIRRVKYLATFIEEEYQHCIEHYKMNAKLFKCSYPGTVNKIWLNDEQKYVLKSDLVRIQIGNSASPTNNHIEILNLLSRFKNENIELYLILSYGGTKDYIEEVKKVGQELFGKKITFIETFLSSSEYYSLIRTIDIAIFNHNFQQGIGNIKLFLSIFKKVYIKNITTTYQYYTRNGFKIYPSESLEYIDFKELTEFDSTKADKNKKLMEKELDEIEMLNQWQQILINPW